jgi:hypothetical protein
MTIGRIGWAGLREEYVRSLAERGVVLHLDRGAWARTATGRWVVLPAATDSAKPDSWWFGFDERALRDKPAIGAVLLCRKAGGELLDFGLPASLLAELAPRLVTRRGTTHRQFNVERRGARFELVARAGERLDITDRRGDLAFLRDAEQPTAAREPATSSVPADPPSAPPHATDDERFFARVRKGALEPLDAAGLEEGATYLVIARRAPSVPAAASLRRLAAAARPRGLPADLSEQHDHYAHGARRR